MIERSLMLRVLTALDAVDTSGIREQILLDEISLEASRHLEASQIREHLAEAKRNGWAECYTGTLRETRWRLLPSGRNTLSDLRG
jgi:hypothetical protein